MYAKVLRNHVLGVQITMDPIFRCWTFLARKHNWVHLRLAKDQMENLKKKRKILKERVGVWQWYGLKNIHVTVKIFVYNFCLTFIAA